MSFIYMFFPQALSTAVTATVQFIDFCMYEGGLIACMKVSSCEKSG